MGANDMGVAQDRNSGKQQGNPKHQHIRRGATATSYALAIGLISITALLAVTTVGSNVDGMFGTVDSNLYDVVQETNPPALTVSPSVITGMDVTGPADPSTGAIETLTLTNAGGTTTEPLSVSNTNSANFVISADGCTGVQLTAGQSCDISVTPQSSERNADMQAVIGFSAGDLSARAELSGAADGFGLFDFTDFTFTNCGRTGNGGPTLSQCQTEYSGQTWVNDSAQFNVSNGIQQLTVPETGTWRIVATGAQGGGFSTNLQEGGAAAVITADVPLTRGDTLYMLVGQAGACPSGVSHSCTGGGGTFVYLDTSTPLVIAGGGGGGGRGGSGAALGNGCAASLTTVSNSCGGNSNATSSGGAGGTTGSAEFADAPGAGGGGWNGAGADARYHSGSFAGSGGHDQPGPGGSYGSPYAFGSGIPGGFGGGGGANWTPGGGGGYSGGAGRYSNGNSIDRGNGGGGSSFTGNGAVQISATNNTFNYLHGSVSLSLQP
ncbi:MAG: hypothetical protein Alpg2KO_31120 [Alphaproteobacteria bacterium]